MRRLIRWLVIVLIPALTLGAACGATILTMNDLIQFEYAANAMVYVSRNRNESYEAAQQSVYQELLATRELAKDFSNFITSQATLAQLQKNLGEEIPWLLTHQYVSNDHFIATRGDDQSRIVDITVYCDNPYDAASIANECVNLLRNLSLLVYGDDYVQVLKVATPNDIPVEPEKKTIFLVACGAGAGVGVAIDGLILLAGARKRKRIQEAAPEPRALRYTVKATVADKPSAPGPGGEQPSSKGKEKQKAAKSS